MMEQVRNEIYKPGTVVVVKDHLEWGEGRVLGSFDGVYAVQFAMKNNALPGVRAYGMQIIEKGYGAEIQGSRLAAVKGAKAKAPEWSVHIWYDGETIEACYATGYDDQDAEELVSVEAPTDAGTNIPGVLMDVAIRMLYGGCEDETNSAGGCGKDNETPVVG